MRRFSFGPALITLAIYTHTDDDMYDLVQEGHTGRYDGLYTALYLTSFVLITRAFLGLAMLEYFPEHVQPSA